MRTITRKVEDYQKQKGKARRNGLGVVVREGLREEVKELRLKKVNIGLKDKTVVVMQVYATQVGRRSNWEDRDEHSWASSMAVSGQTEQDVRRCYQQMDGEDKTCMVWGKTCSGTGNCWIYNTENMRNLLNFTAAGFIAVGALVDVTVWYYVKDVKIFDEEVELEEVNEVEAMVDATQEKLLTEST
uniref:Uncharacterized protein n=1 Tax=Timema bartmani TaxID=61472 RepID=A0A7R9F9D9_9NEOP|nr:unnamed protein product [Timema bartmani]